MTQFFFFFNDTATTEIYTLSLHDALPICAPVARAVHLASARLRHRRAQGREHRAGVPDRGADELARDPGRELRDRKSTRLNSSHANISYAVFCLKKKKKNTQNT